MRFLHFHDNGMLRHGTKLMIQLLDFLIILRRDLRYLMFVRIICMAITNKPRRITISRLNWNDS